MKIKNLFLNTKKDLRKPERKPSFFSFLNMKTIKENDFGDKQII